MVQGSSFTILRSHYDAASSLQRFGIGVAVGIYAWGCGQSSLSAWAFKVVTGFGALLVLPLFFVTVLAIAALALNSRMGTLAYGDFLNLLPLVLTKLLRSASAFFGVVTVAWVCWCTVGSMNALYVALLGSIFGGMLAYCWAGMVLIAHALASRM
ncbi:hypothetical protein [Duganella vulcania]|uniref:Uncharacterized protein n=1 Tax=Duganella vulcania TaxID=2692166 RepID=A0A845GQQ7_9BURK|nr:hypothetical protein [Duganella vulcania]MYM96624.1 hypothetical protein [Duganella vulcania]